MAKTIDGFEAMQWRGQRPMVSGMCTFTECDTEATCPGGDLLIAAPGGSICVKLGQWVVKTPDGLKVVDNDKIVIPGRFF